MVDSCWVSQGDAYFRPIEVCLDLRRSVSWRLAFSLAFSVGKSDPHSCSQCSFSRVSSKQIIETRWGKYSGSIWSPNKESAQWSKHTHLLWSNLTHDDPARDLQKENRSGMHGLTPEADSARGAKPLRVQEPSTCTKEPFLEPPGAHFTLTSEVLSWVSTTQVLWALSYAQKDPILVGFVSLS